MSPTSKSSERQMVTTKSSGTELTAADLMTDDVVTVSDRLSASEAVQVLMKNSVSGAPVVDDKDRCVGADQQHGFAQSCRRVTQVG